MLETDGQVCPFPLVEANQAMQQIPTGDELVIGFDCTQATDFVKRGAAEWTITVKKG
ncbi:sulfurtransferase TusA family protein [Micrococcus sp. KRD096]|uniref:sulfurtransferase TusA family protein n=1 Tax=Micrococcus sp. KRD096 TaxID=2729721 RepID=UPI0019D0C244|nr:sulfurtransferase TusA family protein [Micrococcus sp. KRD096]